MRRIHATLDAISDLVRTNHLKAEDIQGVKVYGSQFLFDAGGYDPKDMAQAQTSVPYVVALLLHYGCVEDHLVHENLTNAAIHEYSRKICVVKDPDIIALAEKDKSLWGAARVEILTNDGRLYQKQQIVPYGDPESPLPETAVQEKFIRHVSDVTDRSYAQYLWGALAAVEEQNQVDQIFADMIERVV